MTYYKMDVESQVRIVDLSQIWCCRHTRVHQRVLGKIYTNAFYYDDLIVSIRENFLDCRCCKHPVIQIRFLSTITSSIDSPFQGSSGFWDFATEALSEASGATSKSTEGMGILSLEHL